MPKFKAMPLNNINVADFNWQIILNPNAQDHKGLAHWNEVAAKFEQQNIRYELHQANGSRKGIDIAQKLRQEGHRHLMVVGGDGTINEVVNGIMMSGVDTREVFLAVIPHGRGNDWARTHHYPENFLESAEGFLQGHFASHDIGLTKVFQEDQQIEQRYFININSYCFSAEVIYETVHNKHKFFNVSVYMLGVFSALFKHKAIPVKIQAEECQYEDQPFMISVANCQYNGGGMRQAPEASYNDGLFDVVIIPNLSIWTVLTKIKYIFSGTHLQKLKGVKYFRTNKLTIDSSPCIMGEMEGELLSQGRYEIELLPNALNVLTFNQE